MLTAIQARMARAALQMALYEVGAAVDLTKEALSQFENGITSVISELTRNRLELFYREHGLHFTTHGITIKSYRALPKARQLAPRKKAVHACV